MESEECNKDLLKFIREARKRGFDDYAIREPLIKQGWPNIEIDRAFLKIGEETRYGKKLYKNSLVINLDDNILKLVEKRARRNLLSVQKQVEDIVRRSCARSKTMASLEQEKLDDLLVAVFSRKTRKKKTS